MIRHFRWQALLALLALPALGLVLYYLASSRNIVVVPDRGGTYVEGVAGMPIAINPLYWQNDTDRTLISLIFSGLTRTSAQGLPEPELAESWESSPDGHTYTFHLRHDVRWHDGEPFSSADVAFTIGVIQSESYDSHPELAALWRNVELETPDAFTVVFHLKEIFGPFLNYTDLGILPAHMLQEVSPALLVGSNFNRLPLGTGPFKIEEIRSDRATLEVNSQYYNGLPMLDRIELRFYQDYPSLVTAYKNNQIAGISHLEPRQISSVLSLQNLQLYNAPQSGYLMVFLNLHNPRFSNPAVRQALLYALDRRALIDDDLSGEGIIAHGPVPPNSWAYNAEIKHYAYDPANAQAILDEAGWIIPGGGTAKEGAVRQKDGVSLDFKLVTNDDPTRVLLAQHIAKMWQDIGAHVTVDAIPASNLARDVLRPRNYDAVLYGWSPSSGDPGVYALWHSSQAVGDGQNYSGFANADADTMLENTQTLANPELRKTAYFEFQKLFAEQVPSLLLVHPVYTYGIDTSVKNVQIGPIINPEDRFRTIGQWYIKTRRILGSNILASALDKRGE